MSGETNQPRCKEAMSSWGKILDAIPKAKMRALFHEANDVERTMREMAGLLSQVRDWILNSPSLGGEESPFVKRIDEFVSRPKGGD